MKTQLKKSIAKKKIGDKIFLSQVLSEVKEELQIEVEKMDDITHVPKYGTLEKFEDGTVGLSVGCSMNDGTTHYFWENSGVYSVARWIEIHSWPQFDQTCITCPNQEKLVPVVTYNKKIIMVCLGCVDRDNLNIPDEYRENIKECDDWRGSD